MPKAKKASQVKKSSAELSYDTKTIIVVITLVTVFPIGVFLMFKWMNWPKWVKTVVLLPIILGVIAFIAALTLAVANPKVTLEKAECVAKCEDARDEEMCFKDCFTGEKESTGSAY